MSTAPEGKKFEKKMKNKATGIIIAVIIATFVFFPVSAEKTYASTENATKVPVLVYHSVKSSDSGKMQISRNKIEKQLNWIKKCGYKTLTMEEFIEWYEGEITIPKKSVLITFDDGFQNVVKNAVPIIKKNKQHATLFVAGYWVGSSEQPLYGRRQNACPQMVEKKAESRLRENEQALWLYCSLLPVGCNK